jgi:hypothetical protein
MRESRTYGSGRGACDETHVPTATPVRMYRVIPFFDSHDVKLLRVLTDRDSEYCGKRRARTDGHHKMVD